MYSSGNASSSVRYGNILNVPTTGASYETAQQDNLNYSGVAASKQLASTDLRNVNKYKAKITSVASKYNVDAALIAAITSRESRGGGYTQNGWGDHGNAFGLMQVDKRHHTLCGEWDSEEHLCQGTEILIYMINAIGEKFPNWTLEQRLKGGIAAYNMGPGNIKDTDVDKYTTGKDYSNDVVARAQFYQSKGF